MNIPKLSMLFVFVVILAIAGLAIAAERKSDEDSARIPQSPGIIMPGDQGSGTLSIVPEDKDSPKIQYRNILFDSTDKDDQENRSNRQYEQLGPDQDKDKEQLDPDDPMNKSYTLPPGTDQAGQPGSDRDSPATPQKEKRLDPSLRPTARNGSPASRSSFYPLQYVVDEPLSENFPNDSYSDPMDEEFSPDRDLGDSDSPDMGDSRDLNMPSDRDDPQDPGLSL
jgi:hypothetical protein